MAATSGRVVAMPVAVVVAPVIAAVIVAARWAIGPGSLADFLFMAQFGLFSINILVGHLKHLTDQC
jgi:hypothetical protein